MTAPHGWDEIARYYGWSFFNGDLSQWESRMVLVKAPPNVSFFYDADSDGMRDPNENSRGIRVHPRLADSLCGILLEIRDAGLWSYVESCAGGYTWRPQRGSKKLSMHSLGAAVDFDPLRNPQGQPPSQTTLGTVGAGVVGVFRRHGWKWGGEWAKPDAMHFQFGSGF